jgi:hypothetical protein
MGGDSVADFAKRLETGRARKYGQNPTVWERMSKLELRLVEVEVALKKVKAENKLLSTEIDVLREQHALIFCDTCDTTRDHCTCNNKVLRE